MNRVFRFLVNLSAGLIIAVIGLNLALEYLISSSDMSQFFAEQIKGSVNRDVKIGAVHAGIWKGLTIENLSISEAAGFSAGTFVSAERVSVVPRFLPLLWGRIVLQDVQITRPRVMVSRNPQGQLNLPQVARKAATGFRPIETVGEHFLEVAGNSAGALIRAMSVEVRSARIRNGEINYAGLTEGINFTASNLSVWLDNLSPSGRGEMKIDYKIEGMRAGKPMAANVTADLNAVLVHYLPSAASGEITITKIVDANFKADRLHAEWDLTGLSQGSPARGESGASVMGTQTMPPLMGMDLTSAEGVLRVEGSAGAITNLRQIRQAQSKWAASLFYPIEVLSEFRGIRLSELSGIEFSELRGDYSLKSGSLNLAPFYWKGPVISLQAEGVMSLRRGAVGLKASLAMGKSSIDITVRGPIDKPEIKGGVNLLGGSKTSVSTKDKIDEAGRFLERSVH